MTDQLLWFLVFIQIIMGGTDTLIHHEFSERLAWQKSAQKELKLHALRNFIYAGLFIVFAWGVPLGLFSLLALGFILLEVLITLWDFVEEDLSRKLPATERVLHTLLALNYGAILVLIVPMLWVGVQLPTMYVPMYFKVGTVMLTVAAIGVALFGIRDYLAARRLANMPRGAASVLAKSLKGKQRILITGATGFIGTRLTNALIDNGHEVTVLSRHPEKAAALGAPINIITNLNQISDDAAIDAIVNLAGEPLASGFWTRNKREKIIQSRGQVADNIYKLCTRLYVPPKTVITASAIGWYGLRGDEILTEDAMAKPCFTHDVCELVEQKASRLKEFNCRIVNLRIGLVLGTEGGMLANLLVPFEYAAGGPLGDGKQWMSWIDLDDLVRMIVHSLQVRTVHGVLNAVTPNPVRNKEFAQILGGALNRPAWIFIPALFLKLFLGDFAKELLLASQRVDNQKITDTGFKFHAPTLEEALSKSLPVKQRAKVTSHTAHKNIICGG